ncbi:type II toxin-antitoxin system HicA family toxin [Clostridium tyrobutyricum]|uniref:type II toxin-antitoxin system HicA family toxin n=1 Tax=Clostridium tyrobutyricum TaxID=1519 RepID=UPI001C380922|nr:type II toxin-antitoxin system HicA family toxin [Clostridium tyrobutyricum]MBV4450907.1 type II toxin-antitoxin system HicA family toxin [Clostridium tyrobutyricum]
MKPLEIKINRDFKILQKQFEDYFFTEGHDKICDIADEIIRKRYLKIHEIIEISKDFYKKDILDIKKYIKENKEKREILDELDKEITSLKQAINCKNTEEKLLVNATEYTKPITDKIVELKAIAYYNNMQKLANQIEMRIQQSLGRITFVLNEICNEVFDPYCSQVDIELNELSEILYAKQLELNELCEEYTEESEKLKITKIFDYKKLNKLIQKNGYAEVRQTGDHKIFSNGQKSIPIPQHVIGLGLTQKIQKQI